MTRSIEFTSDRAAMTLESPEHGAAAVLAYEAFVRQHCARLVQSLTLVTLDQELAADAAQDAFLQLHLHWDEVRRHQNPTAWLYRVGINRCKDYRRHLGRLSKLVGRLAADLPPAGDSVEWESRADAMAMLGRLPLKQRTAAALFYEADFSVAEIAAVMNISQGAVKSHLSRARQSLRQVLEVER